MVSMFENNLVTDNLVSKYKITIKVLDYWTVLLTAPCTTVCFKLVFCGFFPFSKQTQCHWHYNYNLYVVSIQKADTVSLTLQLQSLCCFHSVSRPSVIDITTTIFMLFPFSKQTQCHCITTTIFMLFPFSKQTQCYWHYNYNFILFPFSKQTQCHWHYNYNLYVVSIQ